MKGDTQVILLIAFFFLGFISYGLSEHGLNLLSNFQIATVGATLGAAFLGARYAFSLQNTRESKRNLAKNVEAGNHALFQLSRTYQYFKSIRKEYFDLENDPDRDLLIRPFIGISGFNLRFDFRGLAFLYRSKEPNILNRLAAFQAEVASTLDVIYQRNEIHKQYAQPANEKLFAKYQISWDAEKVKFLMGLNQSINLKEATDAMIECVKNVTDGAVKLGPELRSILETECPSQPFVSYSPNKGFNRTPESSGPA